jgi:hypothetical protein
MRGHIGGEEFGGFPVIEIGRADVADAGEGTGEVGLFQEFADVVTGAVVQENTLRFREGRELVVDGRAGPWRSASATSSSSSALTRRTESPKPLSEPPP